MNHSQMKHFSARGEAGFHPKMRGLLPVRKLSFLFFLPVLLVGAGCALLGSGGGSDYKAGTLVGARVFPGIKKVSVKRIMVIRFINETEYSYVEDQVTEAVIMALGEARHLQVIPESRAAEEILAGEEERPSWSNLSRLRKEADIDAILIGAVNKYRPHEPLLLNIEATLISTESGELLWRAKADYHARELDVRWQAREYQRARPSPVPDGAGDSVLASSARYIEFVAYEVCATLIPNIPR